MLQPRIELGPKRWQRSILPLNYCSLANLLNLFLSKYRYFQLSGHFLPFGELFPQIFMY